MSEELKPLKPGRLIPDSDESHQALPPGPGDGTSPPSLEQLKRVLGEGEESASYCCEAAGTLAIDKVPPEDPFK